MPRSGSASCAPPARASNEPRAGIMKAIVINRFGPPEALTYKDVPDPAPRAGEIRIRIHAATVNRVLDVGLRAGEVAAVAPDVTRWRVGDRVAAAGMMPLDIGAEDERGYEGPVGMMGIRRPGGFAELVCVPASAGVGVPAALD